MNQQTAEKPGKYCTITSTAGVVSVCVACLAIPISTSVMGMASAAAFIFWVISGQIRTTHRLALENPVAGLSLLLFMLFVFGLSYTPAALSEATGTLGKYRELLFIPVVMSLATVTSTGRTKALECFFIGCTVLMLISYAMYFSVLPQVKYGYSVVHHITHSFFMAILAFLALQRSFDRKRYRYLWVIIFILAAGNLFYIAPGRTGMLIFTLLAGLTLCHRLPFRWLLGGLLFFCLTLAAIYFSSQNLSTRINEAVVEIQQYAPGQSKTSLGQRFDWWFNSVELIRVSPLIGHGTGAFEEVQKTVIKGTRITPTDNPHNEYLFIGVQLGLIGLITFLLLLLSQLRLSFRLAKDERLLLQGTVLAMAAGCTMNSFLFDSHQGHFYAMISALLCASTVRQDHATEDIPG